MTIFKSICANVPARHIHLDKKLECYLETFALSTLINGKIYTCYALAHLIIVVCIVTIKSGLWESKMLEGLFESMESYVDPEESIKIDLFMCFRNSSV